MATEDLSSEHRKTRFVEHILIAFSDGVHPTTAVKGTDQNQEQKVFNPTHGPLCPWHSAPCLSLRA